MIQKPIYCSNVLNVLKVSTCPDLDLNYQRSLIMIIIEIINYVASLYSKVYSPPHLLSIVNSFKFRLISLIQEIDHLKIELNESRRRLQSTEESVNNLQNQILQQTNTNNSIEQQVGRINVSIEFFILKLLVNLISMDLWLSGYSVELRIERSLVQYLARLSFCRRFFRKAGLALMTIQYN